MDISLARTGTKFAGALAVIKSRQNRNYVAGSLEVCLPPLQADATDKFTCAEVKIEG